MIHRENLLQNTEFANTANIINNKKFTISSKNQIIPFKHLNLLLAFGFEQYQTINA
jgi:hypothetical protein